MKPAIEIRQVSKTYKRRGNQVEAVKEVTLDISKGSITSLLGPNGSGKTTLIKAMCGLVFPDRGDIFINDYSIIKQRRQALYNMGCILEGERNIYYYLTVYDNLIYFGTLNKIPKKHLNQRIHELLEMLQLKDKVHAYASDLSRGMQQKLALGIALLKDPDVLLLDEPTLGLDVQASHDLLVMIREMADRGKTILLTTHQLELAERVSDSIILFQNGKVLTYESKATLLKRYNPELIVEVTVHPNDQDKMMTYLKQGVEQTKSGAWAMPLSTFETVMVDMSSHGVRLEDIRKREKSLEEIFLEIVGDNNDIRVTS